MIRPGSRVAPRSSAVIESVAMQFREYVKLNDRVEFPIVAVAELLIGEGFEVVDEEDMGADEGRSYPDLGKMLIRRDVYDAAVDGDARSRFTMAHEMGHMVMHVGASYARNNSGAVMQIYENSEWQADEFAGNLLAPLHIIRGWTATQISEHCKISLPAAMIRLKKVKHR